MKYYLIGIKGAGMCALALILNDMGYEVLGSDVTEKIFIEDSLKAKGIKILPFSYLNLKEDYHVIVGSAYYNNHEEYHRAKEMNLIVDEYSKFLGKLAKEFTSIAVTGTHGKTTTSKIIKSIFKNQKKITYLIGDGEGGYHTDSNHFIFEACEYKEHFLNYHPDYAIITNIEYDHVDYFKTRESYNHAFEKFMKQVKNKVIIFGDGDYKVNKNDKIITYGLSEDNDVIAKNVKQSQEGFEFDLYIFNKYQASYNLPFFGYHNLYNLLGGLAIAFLEGLDLNIIQKSLTTFENAKRRFSIIEYKGQIIIDDYAHHHNEIEASINAVKQKYPNREIVSIFQPHTYTRLQAFLEPLGVALNKSDIVYVCDVFASVREDKPLIDSMSLVDICDNGHLLAEDSIKKLSEHKDAILLFMGAGDIYLRYMSKYLSS